MKKLVASIAIGLAGVVLLAGCGSSSGSKALRVQGTFVLKVDEVSDLAGGETSCSGAGGYSDFQAGMDVTVKDGDGTIVGSGSTENLEEADLLTSHDSIPKDPSKVQASHMLDPTDPNNSCWLKFDVPIKKADFYQIEIGHRGNLTYSFADLKAQGFFVEMTLG